MTGKAVFRRRLAQTLPVVAAVAALAVPGASARAASADGQDPWYGYAVSLTRAHMPDPWLGYARALTIANHAGAGQAFGTDTPAPGGGKTSPAPGYRFSADTLAPGGGPAAASGGAGSSFHWSDAGVGAGVTAGTLLALLAGTLLAVRGRARVATG